MKRPEIKTIDFQSAVSKEEKFQNETLRPVIKMKHDLLMHYMRNYLKTKKVDFREFSEEKRIKYISTAFGKDAKLNSEIRGMIMGNFTEEEFKNLNELGNNFRKRIIQIVKERVLTNLHEFDSIGIVS
ncbi:glyoxalase [Reichenbachiella versicolor]|uniref:glyoxalase n=1 Tax=Reichenbachiella versicolor TaxID=1821036 RepID=UPI000D6DDD75|nr:glyoxalase [Reichenbachiella versicolor]